MSPLLRDNAGMGRKKKHHVKPELAKSDIVKSMPFICSNELAAVEFLEQRRWGDSPCCVKCGSVKVFKLLDRDTGERNKRFLWKCRDCRKQYTVRIGTVYEESRIPLRHWCYTFWAMSASKKGVSALQIMRQCQISYKSALFLLHRIRHAMGPTVDTPKLKGICEADETYVGGKPRPANGQPKSKRGRGTDKVPVFAVVHRGGNVRTKVIADVRAESLKGALREFVHDYATVVTDGFCSYNGLSFDFKDHWVINHAEGQYVNGKIHTNTVEGFFATFKRGLMGVYHNVSRKHLHRYANEFEFRYNGRKLNDGERLVATIKGAEGKRLMYRAQIANPESAVIVTPVVEGSMVWKESLFD